MSSGNGSGNLDEIIRAVRAQYGHVYMTQFEDAIFVWRPLTAHEYRDIFSADTSDQFKEEVVCYLCVLWPPGFDFSNGPAGYPSVLTAQILEKSYYDKPDRALALLEKYRAEMANFDCQIDCIIAEAFPNLDIESIGHMTMERRLWLLSRAEWTLANLRGVRLSPQAQQPRETSQEYGVPVPPPPPGVQVERTVRDEHYKGDDPEWIYMDDDELEGAGISPLDE